MLPNLKIVPELKIPGTYLNLLSFYVIESRLFEVNLGQPSSFNVIWLVEILVCWWHPQY